MVQSLKSVDELNVYFGKEQDVELTDQEGKKFSISIAPLPIDKLSDLMRFQSLIEKYSLKDENGKDKISSDAPKEVYDLLQEIVIFAIGYSLTPKEERHKDDVVKVSVAKAKSISLKATLPLISKIMSISGTGDAKDPHPTLKNSQELVQGNQS